MPDDIQKVDLPFPMGGMNRRMAFQEQPDHTTYDCSNVRPVGPFEGEERVRGGVRPGLSEYNTYGEKAGATDPVRLLDTVTVVEQDRMNHLVSHKWNPIGGNARYNRLNEESPGSEIFLGPNPWQTLGYTNAGLPRLGKWFAYAVGTDSDGTDSAELRSAAHKTVPTVDTDIKYAVSIMCTPHSSSDSDGIYETTRFNCRYNLYLMMADFDDNENPDPTDYGVRARLRLHNTDDSLTLGQYSCSLYIYSSGDGTSREVILTGGTITDSDSNPQDLPGWFTLTVEPGAQRIVNAYWQGILMTPVTPGENELEAGEEAAFAGTNEAGHRVGWALKAFAHDTDQTTNMAQVAAFEYRYSHAQAMVTRVVMSAGGTFYSEVPGAVASEDTGFLDVGGNCNLASDHGIQSVEHLQKVYIADWSEPVHWGTFTCDNDDGDDITTSEACDANGDIYNYYMEIKSDNASGNNMVDGNYYITALAGTAMTLAADCEGNTGHSGTFRMMRAPKVFDPTVAGANGYGELRLWQSDVGNGISDMAEQVPCGCKCIALYRDSIVMGASDENPHIWWMGRQGDPNDWDMSFTGYDYDVGRPIIGQNSDAGTIGKAIRFIAPYSDDFMVFGCDKQMWLMRGDPRIGGRLDALSYVFGGIHRDAWCYGPQGELIFWSESGLYVLEPGANPSPQALSEEKLPTYFRTDGVQATDVINMIYDTENRGILVNRLIPFEGEQGSAFEDPEVSIWVDWKDKTFWPEIYNSNHYATATASVNHNGTNVALMGGVDGILRFHNPISKVDMGLDINSKLILGPFKLSQSDDMQGILFQLQAIMAKPLFNFEGTWYTYAGSVTWKVYVADEVENLTYELQKDNSKFSGTFYPGRSDIEHIRVLGSCALIKITGTLHWAFERVMAKTRPAGRVRVL